jgi:DNA polymerase III delta subunit
MATAKVAWISGGMHERKLTLDKIKGQFPLAEVVIIDGDYTVAFLEHACRQGDCFSEERFIVVKSMPYPKGTRPTMINHLKKLLETLPAHVFVCFDGIPANDEKALSGHVSKIGKLFATDEKLSLEHGGDWVVSVMHELGKEIGHAEAQLLMETCGHDKGVGGIGVDVMRIACEKLVLYLGRRKNVTNDDILQTAVPSEDFVIWRIFDAMDSRNICECHNSFVRLCDNDGSVIGAANTLFAISLPRYRMMLFLKESMAAGKSKSEVLKDALSVPKLSVQGKDWSMILASDPEGAKPAFSEFAINAAMNGSYGRKPSLELYSRRDIVRIVNALYVGSAELRARSGSEAATKLLVDSLFLAVCTNLDDSVINRLRESYNYV